MPDEFENVSLWKRTLAVQEGKDEHSEARKLLRDGYLGMRKNASELVKLIPADCKSITVHDITHLDALWEMADLICGPTFPINPAEAFVFGAAVLIHDAGMAVAAYPGGEKELVRSVEWSDAVFALYRRRGLPLPDEATVKSPPSEFKEEILFQVLRAIHAKNAERLAEMEWQIPGKTGKACLLENQRLRTAYAQSIGKIAHSHNWNIERLTDLQKRVGAASELPADWTVDELKLACMLRCADAAHIDERRAPTLLYAFSKPKPESDKHWQFQNKLNKPTTLSGALLYASGQNFELDEAAAWWLCFDTIRMINNELSSSSALLQDTEKISLAVSRVYGAESPRILAQHVRPNGWRPVDAEIKVSDPATLAKTLGGKHLYGNGAYAPIREMLQNSA